MRIRRALSAAALWLLVTSGPGLAQGLEPAGSAAAPGESGSSTTKKKPADAKKTSEQKKPADDKKSDTKPVDATKADTQPAAAPANAVKPSGVPPPEVLLMLVRTTLVALNQANYTANYAVLHGLGTPALKQRNTAEKLGEAFKALRDSKVDLSPVLVLTPQLTEPPALSPQGIMTLKGFFPTKPLQVNFAMAFQPIEGRWLIDGLAVAAVPTAAQTAAQPPAPAAAPASPPTAATDKKP